MRVRPSTSKATSAIRHIVELLACELAPRVEVVLYRPNTAEELERAESAIEDNPAAAAS